MKCVEPSKELATPFMGATGHGALRHKNPTIHGAPGLGLRDPDVATTNTAVQNDPQVL